MKSRYSKLVYAIVALACAVATVLAVTTAGFADLVEARVNAADLGSPFWGAILTKAGWQRNTDSDYVDLGLTVKAQSVSPFKLRGLKLDVRSSLAGVRTLPAPTPFAYNLNRFAAQTMAFNVLLEVPHGISRTAALESLDVSLCSIDAFFRCMPIRAGGSVFRYSP